MCQQTRTESQALGSKEEASQAAAQVGRCGFGALGLGSTAVYIPEKVMGNKKEPQMEGQFPIYILGHCIHIHTYFMYQIKPRYLLGWTTIFDGYGITIFRHLRWCFPGLCCESRDDSGGSAGEGTGEGTWFPGLVSIYLSIHRSIYLSIYRSIDRFYRFYRSIYQSIFLSLITHRYIKHQCCMISLDWFHLPRQQNLALPLQNRSWVSCARCAWFPMGRFCGRWWEWWDDMDSEWVMIFQISMDDENESWKCGFCFAWEWW